MKYILGIDPGITGAISVFKDGNLSNVFDMPVKTEKEKSVIDAQALAFLLDPYTSEAVCFIEFVHSMPEQGVVSVFKFGFTTGVIHGVCAACLIRTIEVSPQVWKGSFGLTANKDDAREKVTKQFSSFKEMFKRKKDHGRAEAVLIGLYGVRILERFKGKQAS